MPPFSHGFCEQLPIGSAADIDTEEVDVDDMTDVDTEEVDVVDMAGSVVVVAATELDVVSVNGNCC